MNNFTQILLHPSVAGGPIQIEIKQEDIAPHNIFNCSFCNEPFRDKKACQKHKLKHHPQARRESKQNKLPASFAINSYTQLQSLSKFRCDVCFKGFDQAHRMRQHEISHREPIFACDQCEKKFKCQYRLKYHKQEHEPGSEQTCSVCFKVFPTLIRLQQHSICHNDKIYECSECQKSFKCKYRLKYHELNHYNKAYECYICFKRFALPSRLAQHLSIHDDDSPSYSCDICLKTFKNKYRLKYHRKEHDKN